MYTVGGREIEFVALLIELIAFTVEAMGNLVTHDGHNGIVDGLVIRWVVDRFHQPPGVDVDGVLVGDIVSVEYA